MDRKELYQRIHLQAEVIDQMERIYQQDGLEQWEDELEQLQNERIWAITSTVQPFPSCLYACVSLTGNM